MWANRRSVACAVERLHGAAAVHVGPDPCGAATMTCTVWVEGVLAALVASGMTEPASNAMATPVEKRGWLTPVSVKIWRT